MSTTNPLIAAFAGEPALVEPSMSDRFEACLREAVAHPHFARTQMAVASMGDDFWPSADDDWGCFVRPYFVADGILQIPVRGVLLNNFPYAFGQWATGYEYIWQAFKRGCGDFATGVIKGIALVEDTPGGMVAGCFDAVDKMVAMKAQVGVPVRAFAHESAYSAGYAIATVADQIVVSRTGGVGSIGVVTSHADMSGALAQAGIKITFIASDDSKVEGNSAEPLSDDAKARIQARIDELYDIFVAAVVRGRGLSEDAIRNDLKAYCYTATQAKSNGLADAIGTLDDALSAFAGDPEGQCDDSADGEDDDDGDPDNGDDETMTSKTTGSVDQAALDNAAALATASADAAATERTRISAILGCEEADGREALAKHLAFNTSMSLDDAKGMLAAAEKKSASAPAAEPASDAAAATFRAAMDKTPNPQVGADNGAGDNGPAVINGKDASPTLALIAAAGLPGFKSSSK